MATESWGPVQAMETVGFAVSRSYIDPDKAERIHSRIFVPDIEPTRDEKGELDVAYSCWDDSEIDEIVDDVTTMFREAGYPDWTANDITLRDTVRGFEEHPDDPWFKWGSAILYLHGTTQMRLKNSVDSSIQSTETLSAGDLLLIKTVRRSAASGRT